MQTVKQRYGHVAKQLIANSKHSSSVTSDRVFQEANQKNRKLIDEVVEELLLPGSRIEGIHELHRLFELAQEGKSCLLLMEHYSNFDIPTFHYLISQSTQAGPKVSNSIIPMAGLKLNAESDFVRAFTEAYTRLVIYPSRSLQPYEGTDQWAEEKKKSRQINMAALHEMVRRKHDGYIILLFPSGTRYRPGNEATRRGLPEVDSYLRAFDYVLPVGISGNILRVNQEGTMADDFITEDVVVFSAGTISSAEDYRKRAREAASPEAPAAEVKQATADLVMAELKSLHFQARSLRSVHLPANHPPDEDGYTQDN